MLNSIDTMKCADANVCPVGECDIFCLKSLSAGSPSILLVMSLNLGAFLELPEVPMSTFH
jgi:hypothetical protein